jgi:hypothetical protein
VRNSSGRTDAQVIGELAQASADWIAAIGDKAAA